MEKNFKSDLLNIQGINEIRHSKNAGPQSNVEKLSIFEEEKIIEIKENIEDIVDGIEYFFKKSSNDNNDYIQDIYAPNEEYTGIKGAYQYFKYGLSKENGTENIQQTANNTIKSFKKINLNTLNDVANYAEFMYTEEYKEHSEKDDVLLNTDRETVTNCLDICDFMNLGYSITPNSNLYNEKSDWQETETKINNDTGFFAKVYQNEKSKEIIIGYCGTNGLEDITTDDLMMMTKNVPEQYEDAINLYKQVKNNEEYKNYKIIITGHSLGGSLAQLVASTNGVSNTDNPPKVITFNAFGTYEIIENQKNNNEYNFLEQNQLKDSSLYNYITEGDFVSCTTKQVGKTKVIENKSPFGHMTGSLHSYIEPKEV